MKNEEIRQKKEFLLKQIEEAFSEIYHPGDENVFVRLHENDVDYDELDYNAFRGLHWKSLTLDFLLQFDAKAILSYFTHKAFQFYLPGLMKVILQNPWEAEELGIRDALVCIMCPIGKVGRNENEDHETGNHIADNSNTLWNAAWKQRIDSFTEKQLNVFCSFLEFMSTYYHSPMTEDDALRIYWGHQNEN